jgi:hypothetical protein
LFTVDIENIYIKQEKKRLHPKLTPAAASNNPPPESYDAGEFLDAAFSFLAPRLSKEGAEKKRDRDGGF